MGVPRFVEYRKVSAVGMGARTGCGLIVKATGMLNGLFGKPFAVI
jgi:hypothetical protein